MTWAAHLPCNMLFLGMLFPGNGTEPCSLIAEPPRHIPVPYPSTQCSVNNTETYCKGPMCANTCQLVNPHLNDALCFCCWALCACQYCNIEALVKELGIPSPFTPFTRSSMWTPDGLQVICTAVRLTMSPGHTCLAARQRGPQLLSSLAATTGTQTNFGSLVATGTECSGSPKLVA